MLWFLRQVLIGVICGAWLVLAIGIVGVKRTQRLESGLNRDGTITLQATLRDEGYDVGRNLRDWTDEGRAALAAYAVDWELDTAPVATGDPMTPELIARIRRTHPQTRAQFAETDRPDCRVWLERPEPKGEAVWDGACSAGYANGVGTLTIEHRHRNQPVISTYEGQLIDGKSDGVGIARNWRGYRYEGDFRNGVFHGSGIIGFDDGRGFEGRFKNGLPDGLGTFSTAGGERSGAWSRGCLEDQTGRARVLNTADGCGYTRGAFVWSVLFD